jgi:hypothetical protein
MRSLTELCRTLPYTEIKKIVHDNKESMANILNSTNYWKLLNDMGFDDDWILLTIKKQRKFFLDFGVIENKFNCYCVLNDQAAEKLFGEEHTTFLKQTTVESLTYKTIAVSKEPMTFSESLFSPFKIMVINNSRLFYNIID